MRSCQHCGQERLLVALHGERGGPDVCLDCSGELLARVGRAQRRERDMFRSFSALGDVRYATERELDAELLRDVLALTHPDAHPPERKAVATRVTAALTALKPHVLPRRSTAPRDGLAAVPRAEAQEPVSPKYPCESCRFLVLPSLYCDACRAKYEEGVRRESEKRNARRRELRAGRSEWRRWTMRKACAGCGEYFTPTRADAAHCSNACRQRAYRRRKAVAA